MRRVRSFGENGWSMRIVVRCVNAFAAGLDPHLASSRKVAAWRQARGMAKSNRTDADLLSELWDQQPRRWEVWLAPPEVRDRREWLAHTRVTTSDRGHSLAHGLA